MQAVSSTTHRPTTDLRACCLQVMATVLEGEEFVPTRQQDFEMADWMKACIVNIAHEIGAGVRASVVL